MQILFDFGINLGGDSTLMSRLILNIMKSEWDRWLMSLFSTNWPYLACSIEKANLQYSNYPCLSGFSITNGGRKVVSILNLKRLGWSQTLPCTKIHLKVKSKPETEGCFRCTWIKCLAPSVAGESFRKRKNCYHLHTFESNFTVLWKNVDTSWCSKQTDLLSLEPYVLIKGSGLASLFLFDRLPTTSLKQKAFDPGEDFITRSFY